MAWNPSPQVAAARDYARKFGGNRVIILTVYRNGQVGYASYGETMALCDEARDLAEVAMAEVEHELERRAQLP